ncbi:MAG: glycosyltransferase family 4 protein [Bacteroidetes bacterium]|nr:glycosyltransferase family 4 protein [Bacteroidota bacterium]
MNIGMILDNEFTGDLRVENEVQALQSAGYNVFVLCLNFGTKPERETYCGASIIRINKSKKTIKKLRALTNTIFNFYPYFWAKHIREFVDEFKIDVLHVHDLYMFGSAFIYNKRAVKKLNIVGDLHENYVEGLKHYRFSTTFPGNFLISIPKWELTEIKWIKKLDYAITVIEEAVERYHSLGIESEKFSVVANYVNREVFNHQKIEDSIVSKFKGKFVVTYIGAFDLHRGIESVVKSMALLKKTITSIQLVLVGTGRNLTELKKMAQDLNVEEIISFEGWRSPDTLLSYIKSSDVCLIPHLKTQHTDNTIPHKLFQYMYFERPLISTNCNPIKRILDETEAGLIYESNNHADLGDKILHLWNNDDLRRKMGENGKKAVEEKYNWKTTSKNLIELYDRIKNNIGL